MFYFTAIRNFIFPRQRDPAVPNQGLVQGILFFALTYQAILCAVHTRVHTISMTDVAVTEACIYLACIVVLIKRIRLEFVAFAMLVSAYLFLLAIFRNQLDPKGFRDVMIPILFYGLGRHIGDLNYADRLLKIMVVLVLIFGFFELWFLDAFSQIFNIFSYYVSQGSLVAGSNWAKDSVLGLNGMRPEGIGRTILPSLLGSHRVSSLFLEPVSLGNFAVIVAAWGLSKRREDIKVMIFFVLAAVTMIALSDSRYGIITVAMLIMMRCLPLGRNTIWMIILPLASVLLLLAIGVLLEDHYGDNILGRLYVSGKILLDMQLGMLFGLDGYQLGYGDMGYPYLLTRLGVLLCLFLWVAFWMLKMEDERGDRFRAYITLYMSLILCVSGTSLFALKTAGICWFLIGCFGVRQQSPTPRHLDKASQHFDRFSQQKEAPNVY